MDLISKDPKTFSKDDVRNLVTDARILAPKIEDDSQKFFSDLLGFYGRRGTLSSNQIYYLIKMMMKTKANSDEDGLNVGSYEKLEKLFERAKKHLKYPGICVQVTGFGTVLFTVPESDKYQGIDIMFRKNNIGSYKYLGTVEDGVYYHDNKRNPLPENVIRLFKAVGTDPIKTFTEYGKSTGICAMCGSGLEDPTSLKMGYGPTCAKNWHLPYGQSFICE